MATLCTAELLLHVQQPPGALGIQMQDRKSRQVWLNPRRQASNSSSSRIVARMGLKIRETYDASFELDPERDTKLRELLGSEVFLKQVGQEAAASTVSFTGEIFQPVPWSPTTQHGMPKEIEKYHLDKENYVIVNVPPNFMFKAKVFKPPRLCAVYKKLL